MKPIKTIRRETGLIEGICEHGIGHPLYASIDWMIICEELDISLRTIGKDNREPQESHWAVHGCDGCCGDHEWQITTLQESIRRANGMIAYHLSEVSTPIKGTTK